MEKKDWKDWQPEPDEMEAGIETADYDRYCPRCGEIIKVVQTEHRPGCGLLRRIKCRNPECDFRFRTVERMVTNRWYRDNGNAPVIKVNPGGIPSHRKYREG